jgi:hypothetical protein
VSPPVPTLPSGLTNAEAQLQLEKSGPNAMPDVASSPLRMAFAKFWAPVPWMLEAATVLELILGKYVEADAAPMVLSAEPLGRCIFRGRYPHRHDAIGGWNRDDTVAITGGPWHAHRGRSLCGHFRFREGARVSPAWNQLTAGLD